MQPNPTNLITVSELQQFAPELGSYLANYSVATISGMISQATQAVIGICNVKGFDRQVVTDENDAQISNEGDLIITVQQYPLFSPNDVIGVNLVKGGFTAALTLSDELGNMLFQVPDGGWRFEFPNSYFYLTGTYLAGGSSQLLTLKGAHVKYQMTYTGGFITIPQNLKMACVLMFRDILKQNINPFGATSYHQGQTGETYRVDATGKSALYKQAEQLLYNSGFVRVAQF